MDDDHQATKAMKLHSLLGALGAPTQDAEEGGKKIKRASTAHTHTHTHTQYSLETCVITMQEPAAQDEAGLPLVPLSLYAAEGIR